MQNDINSLQLSFPEDLDDILDVVTREEDEEEEEEEVMTPDLELFHNMVANNGKEKHS